MSRAPGSRRVDLHLHSDLSDGRFPPEEVLRRCAEGGLDLIALTDHDLVGGLAPGDHVVDGRTVRVLAGAEVSGVHKGHEYHLLVYFPGEVPEAFRAFSQQRVQARAVRYDTAVERLGGEGLASSDALARAGGRSLTRHHLARALVAEGRVGSLRQAFRRYVGYHQPHVDPVDLAFVDAIAIAREAGGLTSWAHPPIRAVERHLATFAEAGLHAVELVRPRVRRGEARRIAKLAEDHGLMHTGGSDWHGWHDTPPGLFFVPEDRVQHALAWLQAA